MNAPQLWLLDIEGTTTPVTFVTEVLFPFARRRLRAFLEAHAAEPGVREQLQALGREHAQDPERPPAWEQADGIGSAVRYLEWQMDRDRKATALKALQGMIWEEGYTTGALRSVVYDDVLPAFERWRASGRDIAIFSSGSVLAQKLLFAHTNAGDLTRFLCAYFDTTTGPKQEAESYRRIAAALGRSPQQIRFASDAVAELDAARTAGMSTALCVRPGAVEPPANPHPRSSDFSALA